MNAVLNILRGIVIGIANVIPGVSGGTMAVSMGIYDKLISSVTGLFKHFKQSMKLLIPLGIGMVIGIVGFGFLLEYLLANHVLATCLTFVGLILGGLPILWLSLKSNLKKTPGRRIGAGEVISFLVLLAIGIGLPLLQGSEGAIKTLSVDPGTIIILFLLGLIASATMVIPGVSGSMVLMSWAITAPSFPWSPARSPCSKTWTSAASSTTACCLLPLPSAWCWASS